MERGIPIMANVFDVANFFIDCANKNNDTMTNLRLQKLLFFAQLLHIRNSDSLLFPDEIEAWKLGPVVREVYYKYRYCGNNIIDFVDDDYNHELFKAEEINTLIDTLRLFTVHSTGKLVDLSHLPDNPWAKTYYENPNNNVIPETLMRGYMNGNIVTDEYIAMLNSLDIDALNRNCVSNVNMEGIPIVPSEYYDDDDWSDYLAN